MSERLGVAVVGVGRWGKNLVRVLRSIERANLVSVYDADVAQTLGFDEAVLGAANFGDVLRDPRIDAVVLATPPATHAELAIAALESGKHVFVEKPMALDKNDAHRILATARARKRRVMVGLLLQYHPAIATLREWIASGRLGDIREIRTDRRGSGSSQRDPGPWWSLAPHDVSAVRLLLNQEPLSVTASEWRAGGTTTVAAKLTFPNGCDAHLVVDDAPNTKTRRIVVRGTRAIAVFDDAEPERKLTLYEGCESANLGRFDEWVARQSPTLVPELEHVEPLHVEMTHFVDATLSGAPFHTDVIEGVRVVDILAAGQESMSKATRVAGDVRALA